ncbi:MAG: hypothetical protein VX265_00390, partial [Myxococcota bacterium]|nr:hypothetical protein [Myxococcota bacterium]MEC8422589.1 hypothetical protein [Myxococcota bacterium]
MRCRFLACLVSSILVACSGGEEPDADPPGDTRSQWRPDLVCPGDEGCPSNEGTLYAGASARDISPPCFEQWEDVDGNGEWSRTEEAFYDCGCDQLCEGDEGWPGPDEGESDGEFQAVWLAGFGQSRPANGVHDPIWARTVAFGTGDTAVALVSLDLVGWFYDDVTAIRDRAAELGADVDLVIVQSTHQHEGPDTLGQWGQRVGKTGVVASYQAHVVEQAAQSVVDAVTAMVPATLHTAAID